MDLKQDLLEAGNGHGPVLEELSAVPNISEYGAVFLIKVVDKETSYEVQRSIGDFIWLNSSLDGVLPTVSLPRKEWFGMTRMTVGPVKRYFVEHRQRTLERFMLNLLSQVQSVGEVPTLEEFLTASPYLDHNHASFVYQDFCAYVRRGAQHEAHHRDSVNYIAMSVDMSMIVSASEDCTCRVWGTHGHRWHCEHTLSDHEKGVDGVAISVDKTLIGSVGEDFTLRIWKETTAEDGTVQWNVAHVCEGHTDAVRFLAIAEDMSFLVTVSDDTTARMWSAAGELLAVLEGHEEAVYGVTIAKDNSFVVTAGDDKKCRVWAQSDGKWQCQQVLEGCEEGIYSVNLSQCCNFLATTSGDNTVRIWGRRDGTWELEQALEGHNAPVYDAAFAPDLSLLASGDDEGACILWAKSDGVWKQQQVLKGHNQTILGVQVVPGERQGELCIATGSADKTSIIWRFDGRLAYKSTHIRPASDQEVGLPVISLLVFFMQNAALAFNSTEFTKRPAIKIVKTSLSISLISLEIGLPPFFQFLVKSAIALSVAVAFMFCAYMSRMKALVFAFSTVMVMPTARQLFTIFDCEGGRLEAVPSVGCYEGFHFPLAVVTAIIAVPYFLLIMGPYTAADGDMEVMPRHVWLQPREWVRRKRDKIIGLDLGLMSPSWKGGVAYAYNSMFSRMILLANTIFLNHYERSSSMLAFAVAGITLVLMYKVPPMEYHLTNVLLQKGQAFCVNAFFASMLATILAPGSLVPEVVLFAGWAAVIGRSLQKFGVGSGRYSHIRARMNSMAKRMSAH